MDSKETGPVEEFDFSFPPYGTYINSTDTAQFLSTSGPADVVSLNHGQHRRST